MNILRADKNTQTGFTLIEIMIVLVIAGLFLAAIATLARPYFENKQHQKNIDAIQAVNQALIKYVEDQGRYPCPAPLAAPRGAAEDGTADCSDPPVQAGITATAGRDGRRVLIGAVPYRQLDIPVSLTIDYNANRLTYAVSLPSASAAYNDGTDLDGDGDGRDRHHR